MSKTPQHTLLPILVLLLLSPVATLAQEKKTCTTQRPDSEKHRPAKAPAKLPLQSITLVSTSEVAQKVAEEESAKARATMKAAEASKLAQPNPEADGAVIEFHPVENSSLTGSTAGPFQARDHKKSLFKNIHGSAYGVTASETGRANGEGGAIGADSRNGKFSFYVDGEHTHISTTAPH